MSAPKPIKLPLLRYSELSEFITDFEGCNDAYYDLPEGLDWAIESAIEEHFDERSARHG